MATKIEGTTVVNVYKLPNTELKDNSIPAFASPCIYAGYFNSQSTSWGYQSTSPAGETLESWASATDLLLLYDPKQLDSFHSKRWNSTINLDLAFAKISTSPEQLVLIPYPTSQHRPSLISLVNPIRPIPSKAVKRWNCLKATWPRFMHLVDNKIRCLPDPASADLDTCYTNICKVLFMVAKRTIPHGYCHQFIPRWDEKCDSHCKAFLFSLHSQETTQTTTDPMQCLNAKCKQQWENTVQSIDFTYSSKVAWKTFNRLTGHSSQPKLCPVTTNTIAHQLLLNGKFKEADKANVFLVKQECTRLWNVPALMALQVFLHQRAIPYHQTDQDWQSKRF